MKPNMFLVDPRLGPEDELTAYWHYPLSVVPGLGQAFVDEVCRLSGLPSSRFIGAIDHPVGDRTNAREARSVKVLLRRLTSDA